MNVIKLWERKEGQFVNRELQMAWREGEYITSCENISREQNDSDLCWNLSHSHRLYDVIFYIGILNMNGHKSEIY